MKKLRISAMILVLSLCLPLLFSCGTSFNNGDAGLNRGDLPATDGGMRPDYDPSGDMIPEGDYGDTGYGESAAPSDDDIAGGDESTTEGGKTLPSGMLTAAAWDDNLYYDYWRDLFDPSTNDDGTSRNFLNYGWHFDSLSRVKVTVTSQGQPIEGATVSTDDFTARTNAAGVAYLFTGLGEGSVSISSGDHTASAEFSPEQRELEITLDGGAAKREVIELMFVVDVTGSMGDELRYLNAELCDVIARVAESNPNAVINLALLFYRDFVDSEVFAYYDFTDVTNADGLARQQAAINSQHATGGGDTPEAVDEVLELAVGKQWSSEATTKIIFLVLDAPPHSDSEGVQRYYDSVMSAAEQGIRICPIICSGADALTEYLTRQAAIYTGGTFVYMTDDSGIGNAHYDPDIPNATVEALNSLMVRLINGYYTGSFEEAVPWRDELKAK